MANLKKVEQRQKRHYRIRKHVNGTSIKPRLSVFRSGKNIYVQLIDDTKGITLASSSSRQLNLKNGSNINAAKEVGNDIAKKIKDLKIKEVVFDRGGFLYHGRIQTLADSIREKGIRI